MGIVIQEVAADSSLATEVASLVSTLGQLDWFQESQPFHLSSHVLAAMDGHRVVGFLRLVVQRIGDDEKDFDAGAAGFQKAVAGSPLLEAKVLAFGVDPAQRRRGIGRLLQLFAIRRARDLGCWQVRSHSAGESQENHRLKVSLGFAVHPISRGDDRSGAYFLLPLQSTAVDVPS